MKTSAENYIENLLKMSLTAENEPEIRNGLQNMIIDLGSDGSSLQNKTLKACYGKLRKLQNFCISSRGEKGDGVCCLNELLDEVCGAADMVLDMIGRGAAFLPCERELLVSCHPSELTGVIMNMLSNACLYSDTPIIDVELKKSGDRAVIMVKNGGKFDLAALERSRKRRDSGAAAMLSFAGRHDSKLLWYAVDDECGTVLSMPVTDENEKIRRCQTPDFSELLMDRLSPVYVGLCDALDGIVF